MKGELKYFFTLTNTCLLALFPPLGGVGGHNFTPFLTGSALREKFNFYFSKVF